MENRIANYRISIINSVQVIPSDKYPSQHRWWDGHTQCGNINTALGILKLARCHEHNTV